MPSLSAPHRIVAVLIASASLCIAQPGGFETASIKRAAPVGGMTKGDPESVISIAGDTLRMQNVSIKDLILTAYGIKPHQLLGEKLSSDRFDLVAKVPLPATWERVRPMLQAFLAERFKLEIHRDSKELSVSQMAVAKGGPKLGTAKPEGPASTNISGGKLIFRNYSMPKLADYLSQRSTGFPIIDATGIDGFYDFSVPLGVQSEDPIDAKRAIGMATRDGSLLRLIVDEIGLRLETHKGAAEVFVVDRLEKLPTEN